MSQCANQPSTPKPKAWIRVIYTGLRDRPRSKPHRVQVVEIALGPQGAD